MNRLTFLAVLPAFLAGCASRDPNYAPVIPGPASSVTRDEAIAIARAYVDTVWLAQARHRFHGADAAAIEIHTPDAHEGTGSWRIDHLNTGVPYKWGGFDTPATFLTGLKGGKYAGDISTPYKRRNLEAAVSKETVGIDCSGLVSRAWRLERAHSTRDLPALCHRLPSWAALRPGDVLNSVNHHVLIFGEWKEPGATLYAYEAGPFSGWRVSYNLIQIDILRDRNYVPLRYKHMVESDPPPTVPPALSAPAVAPPETLTISKVAPSRPSLWDPKRRAGAKR
jgi:hypothetical protein